MKFEQWEFLLKPALVIILKTIDLVLVLRKPGTCTCLNYNSMRKRDANLQDIFNLLSKFLLLKKAVIPALEMFFSLIS